MFELSQVHFCDFHQSEIFLGATGKFFQNIPFPILSKKLVPC